LNPAGACACTNLAPLELAVGARCVPWRGGTRTALPS
jgi:hypothetical protein